MQPEQVQPPKTTPALGERPPAFVGRCVLCGARCRRSRLYCHAHSWAADR